MTATTYFSVFNQPSGRWIACEMIGTRCTHVCVRDDEGSALLAVKAHEAVDVPEDKAYFDQVSREDHQTFGS